MQSADNNELKALSRAHTRQDFLESYRLAREAKFDNINIDVMFGIPYQTYDSLMKTLAFVTRLAPEHISLYNLKIEPGTPFHNNMKAIKEVCADEEMEYAIRPRSSTSHPADTISMKFPILPVAVVLVHTT